MDQKSRDAPPDRISFYVHGAPKGKGRPRFSRDMYGRVHTHTPPESASRKKKLEMIAGEIRPTKRPDVDNVLKAIADSLNGLAYADDAQVVEMRASKQYDAIEGVRVTVYPE